MLAQHSSKSAEWGTPQEWIVRVRRVLQSIDLDPASSAEHDQVVIADRYYTKNDNALTRPWQGRVFLNPPGGRGLPQKFLEKLCLEYSAGRVTTAVYLGYALEQLLWVKRYLPKGRPIFAVPNKRIKFIGAGNSPTHGNFFLYLGRERYDWELFEREFSPDCLMLTSVW